MEESADFTHSYGNVSLDEKYAFAFSHYDGFSHRLLKAQLKVTWDCHYVLEMNFFESRHNSKFPYCEEGRIETNILQFFERLMECDYTSLKDTYENKGFFVTDIGSQIFLLNFERATSRIVITDGLPVEYFEAKAERLLYDFNEYLKNMIEDRYNSLRKS